MFGRCSASEAQREAGRDRSKGTRAERRWQQGRGGAEGGDSRVEREGRPSEVGGEAAERSKGGGEGGKKGKEKKRKSSGIINI